MLAAIEFGRQRLHGRFGLRKVHLLFSDLYQNNGVLIH
jgi:hypothetical protein